MHHGAFPIQVSFQGDTCLVTCRHLRGLHAGGARPQRSLTGSKRADGMEKDAPLLVLLTLPVPGIQLWKAQTGELCPFAIPQTDPQSNCATGLPTHLTCSVFDRKHFPIGISTVHASPSRAANSNNHMGTHECHAGHTVGKGEVGPEGSGRTACLRETVQVAHLHQHSHTYQSWLL